MTYCSGSNHIHVDIDQALDEVMVCAYGSSEIAVLPKCAFARFAAVVLLGKSAGYKLHTSRYHPVLAVFYQQVDVIGCDDVVEDRKVVALSCFEK
jgi:hypothetical protein